MQLTITQVLGREVMDSRGNPTVEAEVHLSNGASGRALVPSGASKGVHEALELRAGDPSRFLGKGVQKAVGHVNGEIARFLVGKPASGIREIDRWLLELDGTQQKARLGANSILAVSLAFGHALASVEGKPLFAAIQGWMGSSALSMPIPLMNILNGGLHANNGLEIQEFMIVPHGFESFAEALRAGCEIFHTLKKDLDKKGYSVAVGDEGGFAPKLESNLEALGLICTAVEKAGYRLGDQVALALDVAASSFFDEDSKKYQIESGRTSQEMIALYRELLKRYPLFSIEDGLQEADWEGWQALTQALGTQTQLVGDDLFVTQEKWVKKGMALGAANAVLIKVNQVGTLSETFATMDLAVKGGYASVVSHRSGETEDVTIAHLAVGSGCGQIKTGSASRSERMAKYNELLRIEGWGVRNSKPIPLARFPKR